MSRSSTFDAPDVTIYTDGGADPNPGPGGWGAVLLRPGTEPVELSGGTGEKTTNNRMELMAAIEALDALDGPSRVVLYTDSTYLKQGITSWLPAWRRAGWKRKGGALKNVDLWQALSRTVDRHRIDWRWVKGHAGNRWNERADELASAAVRANGGGGRNAAGQETVTADIAADIEVMLAVSCPRGRGAWAAFVVIDGEEHDLHGHVDRTTVPRLEILAASELLEGFAPGKTVAVRVASDYLRKGASMWLKGWRKGGWRTKAGAPVKNRDAWERLDAAQKKLRVRWLPVRDRPDVLKALEKRARELATR